MNVTHSEISHLSWSINPLNLERDSNLFISVIFDNGCLFEKYNSTDLIIINLEQKQRPGDYPTYLGPTDDPSRRYSAMVCWWRRCGRHFLWYLQAPGRPNGKQALVDILTGVDQYNIGCAYTERPVGGGILL